ncbi:TusE/DsrC/DsvC family sulfur relay protein [Cellvibrio sp. UBA7661]|uniref:TusE/DsrC/DsvC family sulfur relay protein n=1 Tax=Cellvibrio sp. UBA7661 TaxID=1946311 RepID=UPI002F352462
MIVAGQNVPLDKDGHLINLTQWNPQVAQALAAQENIVLTHEHWEIVNLIQEFYREYQISPAMRALVKYTEKKLGQEKGKSVYLLQLFPPSPARIASKVAGLPRPTNCL